MEFLKFISVSSETSKKVDTIHTEYSEMQKDAIDYFNKSTVNGRMLLELGFTVRELGRSLKRNLMNGSIKK